jgi:hypothetical protein
MIVGGVMSGLIATAEAAWQAGQSTPVCAWVRRVIPPRSQPSGQQSGSTAAITAINTASAQAMERTVGDGARLLVLSGLLLISLRRIGRSLTSTRLREILPRSGDILNAVASSSRRNRSRHGWLLKVVGSLHWRRASG